MGEVRVHIAETCAPVARVLCSRVADTDAEVIALFLLDVDRDVVSSRSCRAELCGEHKRPRVIHRLNLHREFADVDALLLELGQKRLDIIFRHTLRAVDGDAADRDDHLARRDACITLLRAVTRGSRRCGKLLLRARA